MLNLFSTKKIKKLFFIGCVLGSVSFSLPADGAEMNFSDSVKLDYECLQEAYPEFFQGIERSGDGCIYLITKKGEKILYDDGKEKTLKELIHNADVEDTMRTIYPLDPARPTPKKDENPGRYRSNALLKALYGDNFAEMRKNIVPCVIGGADFEVSKYIVSAFENVNAEILPILQAKPALKPHFKNVEECFYIRKIAGTNTMSAHSWGIALDLNAKLGTYWQWSKERPHPTQKTYPTEIVQAFEKNGFVWGGKWYHYDMMHFEYRPEVIIKAKKLGK